MIPATTALLSALLALPAQAATPLPDAASVQAAIRRAIEAEIPTTDDNDAPDFGKAMLLGRLLSIEVADVPGCVPVPANRMTCIVSIDKGLGQPQLRHRVLQLEWRGGQWEIPHPGQDPRQEPAPPAPTPAQAQIAVREYAQRQLARGVDDDELRRAATGFRIDSLGNCQLVSDASVACDVAFALPDAAGTAGTAQSTRMNFRLHGSQWRYGEPASAD
jgi:hypothetical protein